MPRSFFRLRALLCAVAVLLAGLDVQAEVLVLTDGSRIETRGPYSIEGKRVIFVSENGTKSMVRLSNVNVEASKKASAAPTPESTAPEAAATGTTPQGRPPSLVLTNSSFATGADGGTARGGRFSLAGPPPRRLENTLPNGPFRPTCQEIVEEGRAFAAHVDELLNYVAVLQAYLSSHLDELALEDLDPSDDGVRGLARQAPAQVQQWKRELNQRARSETSYRRLAVESIDETLTGNLGGAESGDDIAEALIEHYGEIAPYSLMAVKAMQEQVELLERCRE